MEYETFQDKDGNDYYKYLTDKNIIDFLEKYYKENNFEFLRYCDVGKSYKLFILVYGDRSQTLNIVKTDLQYNIKEHIIKNYSIKLGAAFYGFRNIYAIKTSGEIYTYFAGGDGPSMLKGIKKFNGNNKTPTTLLECYEESSKKAFCKERELTDKEVFGD